MDLRCRKILVLVGVCILLAWGFGRAAAGKYQQKRAEILAACKAEREKLSPADQKALESKCPTPEVALVSPAMLLPGQTAEVTVTGKFQAGTRFLFESDGIEVLKESVAPNIYKATIKISADSGPQNIAVQAFAPYCCKSARRDRAISVGGNFEWNFAAGNGWQVKGHTIPPSPDARSNDLLYMLEFYRSNEATPFAKRKATLYPSAGGDYSFSISSEDEAAMGAQQQLEALTKKMMDPSLSDAERQKVMKQMQDMSQKAMEDMKKMTDPAYIKKMQAQQDEFGCRSISVKADNGNLTGTMGCSQKVGTSLKITGTMKYLGK